MYTIHAVKYDNVVPTIFALLPDKSEATYIRLFESLKQLQAELNPLSIMTDFEKASINAFSNVFPNAELHGCYFHFTQCIWRRIQGIPELLRKYTEDTSFALQVRQLAALSFVPIPDVIEAFEALQDSVFFIQNECTHPLLNYIEETWIGKPFGGSGQRRNPLFPIALWNIFFLIADGNPRTNNSVEGWHRGFSSLLGADHPSLWKFIDGLRREQSLNELKIEQYISGQAPPQSRKKYRELSARILSVVQDYGNRPILDYLRGIAYSVNLNV